jgi:hypothetical protein
MDITGRRNMAKRSRGDMMLIGAAIGETLDDSIEGKLQFA